MQRALKITAPGTVSVDASTSLPTYRVDQVLVRVSRVGLNPVDAKSVDLSPSLGATIGADFAGEVVAVGSALRRPLKIGDRVFGCVFGNNPLSPGNGAFAEYVAACADLLWKVPESLSLARASVLGVGLVTVGLGLYHSLGLHLPVLPGQSIPKETADNKEFVLVYGGGTATGLLAIQMLRLSGYSPITTCSPSRNTQCKEMGAVACFDYRSATCGADIRVFTTNALHTVFDTISTADSMKICYAALAAPTRDVSSVKLQPSPTHPARYLALDPFPARAHTRRSVAPDWIIAFTVFDQEVLWAKPYAREAKPLHRQWAATRWFPLVQGLLEHGCLQDGQELEMREGGLEGIEKGLLDLRNGVIGARKLVFAV